MLRSEVTMTFPRLHLPSMFPALLGVALLSGCAFGAASGASIPAVSTVLPTGGVGAHEGAITLNDAYLQGAATLSAGASAPLRLDLTDDGPTADALVAVSTPVATGADVPSSILIPAGGTTDLESRTGVILTGLRQPLHVGQWFPVTLRFTGAGSMTVDVTVAPLG
jgi:periplasmic copper chaperone A